MKNFVAWIFWAYLRKKMLRINQFEANLNSFKQVFKNLNKSQLLEKKGFYEIGLIWKQGNYKFREK